MRFKKTGIFILVLLGIGLATKFILPSVLLRKLNEEFAKFSPTYSLHIESLELHFIKMSYSFEKLEARFKKDKQIFAKVEKIEVSIAWRELIRARILTDVAVTGGEITLSKAVIEGSQDKSAKPKEDATQVSRTLFPVDVARISLDHSQIDFSELISQPKSEGWRLSAINAMILNLTPSQPNPETFITLNAKFLNRSTLKAAGKLHRLDKPLAWKFDVELHGLDLAEANPILMRVGPISFAEGTLDAYAEVRDQHGELQGYVKPFFEKLKVLKPDQRYKGVEHFFIEILTAISNSILRKSDTKTVATKVPFHMENGKLKVDIKDTLSSAIDNGFGKPISPGIEDSLKFK